MVFSLVFFGFEGTDVSGLKTVVILDISSSRTVADVTMLHSLQVLKIQHCDGITSLTGMPNLRELWMNESDRKD
jgi:hypothetical protein